MRRKIIEIIQGCSDEHPFEHPHADSLKKIIYNDASCILKMHLTGNPIVLVMENGIVIYMDRL